MASSSRPSRPRGARLSRSRRRRRDRLVTALVAACLALVAVPAEAATVVRVAAAANLRFALGDVILRFEKANPDIDVQPTYGASGSLFAQILQGAPFDVFLSADTALPQKLVAEAACRRDGLFVYATGQLVLWMPKRFVDIPQGADLQRLLRDDVRRIAIANPQHAPYGQAAVQALRSAGVFDAVQTRIVHGENVAQAAQLALSGSADVAILAGSVARAPVMLAEGAIREIPPSAHAPIVHAGCIVDVERRTTGRLRRRAPVSPPPAGAEALRAYLLGAEARDVFAAYGLSSPPAATGPER